MKGLTLICLLLIFRGMGDPPAPLPQWIRALPTLDDPQGAQWHAVPKSDMCRYMDKRAAIEAGMLGSDGRDIGFGQPFAKFGYSGGAKRDSSDGCTLMIHGNGGATGCSGTGWRGSDVDGLRLDVEAPVWETIVKPASFKRYWSRTAGRGEGPDGKEPTKPGTDGLWRGIYHLAGFDLISHMSDPAMPAVRVGAAKSKHAGEIAYPTGDEPNAGHTYDHFQYIQQIERGVRFGCGNMQEGDCAQSPYKDSFAWKDRRWIRGDAKDGLGLLWGCKPPARVGDPYTGATMFDAPWGAQDYSTGDYYYPMIANSDAHVIRWTAATQTDVDLGIDDKMGRANLRTSVHYGTVAIDEKNKRLLRWGPLDGDGNVTVWGLREYDVSGAKIACTHLNSPGCALSGPGVPEVTTAFSKWHGTGSCGLGFLYSRLLSARNGAPTFVLSMGSGDLYTARRTGTAAFAIEKLPIRDAATPYVNGAGQPKSRATQVPNGGIYNRFWEFERLGLIVVLMNSVDPVWVVRVK